MIEISRDHSTTVKRWRDGQMVLRWCAAGMVEASKQSRRVNGFMYFPALRKALEAHVAAAVTPIDYNKEELPEIHGNATEVPRDSGHPPAPKVRAGDDHGRSWVWLPADLAGGVGVFRCRGRLREGGGGACS
jgi:hypothetical protein